MVLPPLLIAALLTLPNAQTNMLNILILFLFSASQLVYADSDETGDNKKISTVQEEPIKEEPIKVDSLKKHRKENPNDEEVIIRARKYSGIEEFNHDFEKRRTDIKLNRSKAKTAQEYILDHQNNVQGAIIRNATRPPAPPASQKK